MTFKQMLVPVILLCCFTVSQARGNYYLRHYTTSEGLPHNMVYSIAHDSNGFLWLATWDGLSCFDGYSFRNYYHVPGDTTTVPYFNIRNVIVDGDNRVWGLTEYGELFRVNRATDKIIQYPQFSKSNKLYHRIIDINIDMDKNLVLLTNHNLIRYHPDKDKFTFHNILDRQKQPLLYNENYGKKSVFDNKGNLWLIGYSGLVYAMGESPKDSGIFVRKVYHHQLSEESFLKLGLIKNIYVSDSGTWLLTDYGLYKLDTLHNTFKPYQGDIQIHAPLHEPLMWNTLKDGLTVIRKDGSITRISSEIVQKLTSVIIDRNNALWFGSVSPTGFGLGLGKYIEIPAFSGTIPLLVIQS
ncbi:MAG: hypothetical protein HC830_09570 [Bacteroidetes bacterium]|nr:hypothetical protein [Bacteroidota bacterium]